jgi:CTP synthase
VKAFHHPFTKERVLELQLSRSQIVPHITNAIQDWIERVSKIPVDETDEEPDVCIVEVCLSLPFIHILSLLLLIVDD